MVTEIIDTGTGVMNELLDGGYESDIITTIYGPASSGKTTACLLACISAAKKEKKSIFIDTEGGVSMSRLKQLCGEEEKKILPSLLMLRPKTFDEQREMIVKLPKMINERVGLIVVDTIATLYRLEAGKSDQVKGINKDLGRQLGVLGMLAGKHHIPVLVTNQVYSDFAVPGQVKMVGGDILPYASKCIIEFQKFKTRRKAIVRKHRSIEENREKVFMIVEKGIEEVTPRKNFQSDA